MKILSILLAALCFATTGKGGEPAALTEAQIEAQMVMLQSVTGEFFRLSSGEKPVLTWKTAVGKCEQNILPLSQHSLATADFAPLHPLVDKPEEYCAVNVCADKDPDQRPVYLYLFSYKERTAKLVAAFHVQDGKAERIKG